MLKIDKYIDILTGEEITIEREETEIELAERLAFEKEIIDRAEELKAKNKARAEVLAKLGLTEDEIQALLP